MKLLIVLTTLFLYTTSLSAEEAPEGYKRVKFSEVCFWPEEGESEWIELFNASDSAIDISGWTLKWSGGGEYVFPSLDLIVPLGVVVINLGENTDLELGKLVELNSSVHKNKNNLDENKCQVILIDNVNVYVDKVTWGDRDIQWDNLNPIDLRTKNVMDEVSSEALIGPAKFSKKGGTISLIKYTTHKYETAWIVNYDSETTKGLLSLDGKNQAPMGFGGMEKVEINLGEYKNENYYLKVLNNEIPNCKYEFQVARDTLFSDVVFTSSPSASFVCSVEREHLPDIKKFIYWRARYVWPDGGKSNWSSVYELYGGDYEVTDEFIIKPKP